MAREESATAGDALAASGAPATTMASSSDDSSGAATEGDGASGGADGDTTNVAVEGVDELDLIDRLADDVYLVATAERLAIVDLAAAEVRDSIAVAYDAQVTYDRDRGIAWVVGHGTQGGVVVERIAVDGSELTSDARWTTSGRLVDARRVGGSLHLVAAEGFPEPMPGGPEPVPGPAVDVPPASSTVIEDEVVEEPVTEETVPDGSVTEPGFEGEEGTATETTLAPDAPVSSAAGGVAAPETTIPDPDVSVPTTSEPEVDRAGDHRARGHRAGDHRARGHRTADDRADGAEPRGAVPRGPGAVRRGAPPHRAVVARGHPAGDAAGDG